jgi:rubrerythrin
MYGITCRREHYHRIRLEGFDVCTRCGYWLRGLGDDVRQCPECGAEREAMTVVGRAERNDEPSAEG